MACTYLCTCVKEMKASLKFLHKFYIWIYKHRFLGDLEFWREGTGWMGLELSIIFMQTVRRSDMWVGPYTGILTLAKLKYFMTKELSNKALWSCTAANSTRRHSERGKRLNQICLHKTVLTVWTVLTFRNTSGGYLTQAFHSQTLRDDL